MAQAGGGPTLETVVGNAFTTAAQIVLGARIHEAQPAKQTEQGPKKKLWVRHEVPPPGLLVDPTSTSSPAAATCPAAVQPRAG